MQPYFLLLLTLIGSPALLPAAAETPLRPMVVFSEVLADPQPPVGLPETPFIELFNRSEQSLQLAGWQLEINGRSCVLDSFQLAARSWVVLVPAAKGGLWEGHKEVLPLKGFSSLTLTSGTLVLRSARGGVIDALAYSRTMGQAGFKRDGGWSLERKDTDHLSHSLHNWDYSLAPEGGTPGDPNSLDQLLPDEEVPRVRSLHWQDAQHLVLQFSKNLSPAAFEEAEVLVGTGPLSFTTRLEEVWNQELLLSFDLAPEAGQVLSLYWAQRPYDWAGNLLVGNEQLEVGLPELPRAGDVVINELLYEPPTGGSDYIELYNCSARIVDLSSLYLSRAGEDGLPEKLFALSQHKTPFMPGTFLVVCGDHAWLRAQYGLDDFLLLAPEEALPNYINEGGSVLLTNRRGEVLDRMDYHAGLHNSFLDATKGVALERLDVRAPSLSPHNWQSAAADAGYGTPGRPNSQSAPTRVQSKSPLRTEPELFSPNGDGQDDLLYLHYAFEEAGLLCSVTIYNERGLPVRRLVNNAPAGREGFWVWDGSDDEGRVCPPAWYVLQVHWHGPGATPGSYRTAVALGR